MGDDNKLVGVSPASLAAGSESPQQMPLAFPGVSQGVHLSFTQPSAIPPALTTPEALKETVALLDNQNNRQHLESMAKMANAHSRKRLGYILSFASFLVAAGLTWGLGQGHPELLKELITCAAVGFGSWGIAKQRKDD